MQEQSFSTEKLQMEFDHLFLRAVLHVLKAKRYRVIPELGLLVNMLQTLRFGAYKGEVGSHLA